jgi:methyl-accepting chemotaxis protein
VKKVEDGTHLVSRSGEALNEIVISVKKVSDIVAEIAAASREQSSGIDQVNKAVSQMDQMTQQNAALVEQATAASQNMTTEASALNEMMAGYDFAGVAGGFGATISANVHSNAAPAASQAAQKDGASGARTSAASRAERRKATRPWSNRTNKSQPAAAPRPEAAVASVARNAAPAEAGKDSNEWQEF